MEGIIKDRWDSEDCPSTIRGLNKKAYAYLEVWWSHLLLSRHDPYVYVDEIYLRSNGGGEFENVTIPMWIAVEEVDRCLPAVEKGHALCYNEEQKVTGAAVLPGGRAGPRSIFHREEQAQ